MPKFARFTAVVAVTVSAFLGGTLVTRAADPQFNLIQTGNSGQNAKVIPFIPNTPCWRQGSSTYHLANASFSACTPTTTTTTTSTTTVPPTTTTTTTTTVAPTTSTSTSTSTTSTTVAPPTTTTTTAPAGGAQFVETFDGNTGLNRFNAGVWHRDPYLVETTQWEGDHDLACGGPDTHRTIHKGSSGGTVTQYPAGEYFYTCANHMMDSVGDTSGYSIAWFSPAQTFASVDSVSFDVNLTNLGDRKWWKIVVVSDSLYNTTWNGSCCGPAQGFLFADNGSVSLPGLEGPGRLVATWGEDRVASYPYAALFGIGNSHTAGSTSTDPNDKMTRFPVSLVDNKNGTSTFTVAGQSVTQAGSFPACPCRVVIEDHNYTPNKSFIPRVLNPYTWHWDSIVVR